MGYEPTFNLTQAAEICKVSASTMRRHRDRLVEGGARVTQNVWEIPISALIFAGFTPHTPENDRSGDSPEPIKNDRSVTGQMTGLEAPDRSQMEALKARISELEKDLAVANAQAIERDRIIEAQQFALRALEAGTARPAEQSRETPAQTPPAQPVPKVQETVFEDTNAPWNQPEPPRGFWARLFGR